MPRRLSLSVGWFDSLGTFERYAVAALLVIIATVTAALLAHVTGSNRVGPVFLVTVLVVSYLLGSGPGYATTAASFVLFNALIAGVNFNLAAYRADDVLVLLNFPVLALLMGNLTGRVRDEAKRAETRARTTEALFYATREFSASDQAEVIRTLLAQRLAAATSGEAFVLSGADEVWTAETPPPADVLSAARALERGEPAGETPGWDLRSLGEAGVAGWRTYAALEPADQALLQILTDSGAIAIARSKLATAKADEETRSRTEDLRNALLSSISHDLRTPLAAVLASATALQEFGDRFDAKTRRDLTNTIQEEAERLNAFVTNLLNMTKLESGALDARRAPFDLSELVERTRRRFDRVKGERSFRWLPAPEARQAVGDPVLFEVALGNVLENAVRYSPDGSAIILASLRRGCEVVLTVTDSGPGVPPQELPRLFDKFYRGSAAQRTPGTGLGLSIVRGVMQGMGGAVHAGPRPDGAAGLVVSLSLPAEAE